MTQEKDNSTINVNFTAPTGWDKLDDHQLRYVFGLMAQGFPSPQVKTYCLLRWTGMQVMHKYGRGWWCIFADDEFVIAVSAAYGMAIDPKFNPSAIR